MTVFSQLLVRPTVTNSPSVLLILFCLQYRQDPLRVIHPHGSTIRERPRLLDNLPSLVHLPLSTFYRITFFSNEIKVQYPCQ